MKQITSPDNPFFKTLTKLASSTKQRHETGQTLLDGIHLLQAYLVTEKSVQHVIINEAALQNNELSTLFKKIPDAPLTQFSDNLFAELSELKTPSGILTLINIPNPTFSPAHGKFCLLLEDIQDPGNLGSILRSAAGAGCDAIFLSKGCADVWSPKVLRSAMGGHFTLDIHETMNLLNVAQTLPGKLFATSPHAKMNLYQTDLRGDCAFAIGNEGAGLSRDLLTAAHQLVSIPMPGNSMPGKVESLNVAAATAVCVFEAARQRGQF
ncbi:MAG: RNA methyltransferase [Candidatus Nitrotoga sp.]